MSNLSQDRHVGLPLDNEECSALVGRVSNSPIFQRCARLRELFLYLCHASRTGSVSEHQIGVDVFGRKPGYDSSADTIARVQVSQLRKKLQQYFQTEGASEPILVEFPKGSYAPVYRTRDSTPEPQIAASLIRPSRRPGLLLVAALACALTLVTAASAWLLFQNHVVARSSALEHATPALDRFWRELFPAAHNVQLVVADANLMVISDMMKGHVVSLSEYRSRKYPADLIGSLIPDSKVRKLADHISGTHLTSLQDAETVGTIVPLSIRYRFPVAVVHAREFRMQSDAGNLILVGHRKGNPWVELFEPRMNFHYTYSFIGTEFRGVLVNRSPQPGEEPQYVVDYEKNGYALIAYLPKPLGDGTALLLSGTDMSSVEASSRFVADEASVARLLDHLRVGPRDRIPYFEILLRTSLLSNTAPRFEIIAYRRPKI